MANHKRSVILFSIVTLIAIVIAACQRPYSNVPVETAPPAAETSMFVSPFPTSDNPMAMVEELSTGTAMAETSVALTAGTPPAVEATVTETIAGDNATSDQTIATNTETPALSVSTATATQPLPTAIVNRPTSYTLQKGEFPYCIARRFNLDPAELLSLNNLASGDIYYPNLTMTIPQSGKPFPGTRALRSHPDTYTVADANLTLYGVACAYGDADPAAIAQANNLQLTAVLTVGQQLSIP